MAPPLLETKLYVPRRRRGVVPRPRLGERLDRGTEGKLTLVSAPAGFGKTTLLTAWLETAEADARSTAWLSLDESDNHPTTFWTYIIAALRTVEPGVGSSALQLLGSPQPAAVETILSTLLNELGGISNEVVLVLDDYHVIDSQEIQNGMVFLLDHLPPRLHLVIASRSDPALPLARLRARGELVEIRAEDLRFAADEAATYFRESMGLDLTARDVAALEGRTEGWIAALQLAALSMQGRSDVAGFIAGFAGDDRYIVDYLVEEVLQRQPDPVRSFLHETSILDRLSGPLCDAVTGQGGGKAMLEVLERGNLFVVPLDDRRRWYRYHQLFADVLRARLLDEQPERVPELHRRASAWYERNGERSAAIRHALAAEDFPKVADLIELALPELRRDRQEAALQTWVAALPDDLLRVRPVLSAHYGGVLLALGQLDEVEPRLRDAERWLNATAGTAGMVVVDEEEFRRLPGTIAVWRAGHALVLGDLAETVRQAQRALDLLPEEDHLGRGGAAALMGIAAWAHGDLEAAHSTYTAGIADVQRAGFISDALSSAIALADIRVAQGRLHDAMRTLEQAVQLATAQGEPVPRGTADLYIGMGELHRERGDLQAATQHVLRSQELGVRTGFPPNRSRWCVALARIHEAQGDLDGALELLDEAERLYVRHFFPNVRPIAAFRARVWTRQGKLDEALGWARAHGLSAEADLSYLREFEHVTLARVLLARRSIAEARGLLQRLQKAAEDGGRNGTVIEVLVLQAVAHQMQHDIAAALEPLGRALALAEPEGYIRIFVDEGAPIGALLAAAAKRQLAPDYIRLLMAACGAAEDRTPVKQGLIEPLSERELDVLRLLGTDLDGPDIARQLMVSPNTMRTHTKNIYSKLGVNNRRAAVRRAEELKLLSPTRKQ